MSKSKDIECKKYQNLLYFILFTLVFEGILRKAFFFLSVPLFFFKDFLCIYGLFLIMNVVLKNKILGQLQQRWSMLLFAFVPVLLATGLKDIILLFFGSKQYLIFPTVAFLMVMAFPKSEESAFKKFVYVFSLLLLPTTILAILQNTLPPEHWLNKAVGGNSLEWFSAGGYLRVSSTFSFTGQYSYYLNATTSILIIYFYLPYQVDQKNSLHKLLTPAIQLLLILGLIVGGFITGGRTAVFGIGLTLIIGFILAGYKYPPLFTNVKIISATFTIIFILSILIVVKPEYFAAYTERSTGFEGQTNNEEVGNRVLNSFINSGDFLSDNDVLVNIFGNGLGVMSNGSEQISSYAKQIRATGFWTETDFPTTLWEGGIYLAIVWYSFRFGIIILCYKQWNKIKQTQYLIPASFLFAYIIIIGVTGTLGIQPPLAIWWWLTVGGLICLHNFDSLSD